MYDGDLDLHHTINERSDGLVAMSMDVKSSGRLDQPLSPRWRSTRGRSADDGRGHELAPVQRARPGQATGERRDLLQRSAPLALAYGTLLSRGQKELKALQVAN